MEVNFSIVGHFNGVLLIDVLIMYCLYDRQSFPWALINYIDQMSACNFSAVSELWSGDEGPDCLSAVQFNLNV